MALNSTLPRPSPSLTPLSQSALSSVVAHVDGCVGPGNPGTYAGVGVVIGPHPLAPGLTRGLCVAHPCAGRTLWSSNAAEYEAALVALRVLYRASWRGPVTIYSD